MLGKILIGYALAVFGLFVAISVAVILVYAHQSAGWTGVIVGVVFLAALPAGLAGVWLKVRND